MIKYTKFYILFKRDDRYAHFRQCRTSKGKGRQFIITRISKNNRRTGVQNRFLFTNIGGDIYLIIPNIIGLREI